MIKLWGSKGSDGNAVQPVKQGAAAKRRRRLFLWNLAYKSCGLLILIAMIPAALGLLYRVEPIHPVSTLMLARWASGQKVDRRWVEIEDVAPIMVYSAIMSEDGQFCSHRGVDWAELNAVIDDALDGSATRGASTIPMQTAKNLFLWNGRSFLRKAMEIPLAFYLDGVLSKRRIMEIYLNIAEWDDGVFGVEAAARTYFGKSAADLTPRQAALLAVTLPAPKARDPGRPAPGLQRLARLIEKRAAKSGGYVGCVR